MVDTKFSDRRAQPEKPGITVRKEEDLSEWYTQVVLKAELADYSSSGKGFIVIRPNGYEIWDNIRAFFDQEIKKTGHRNAYFPTLISETLLRKEADHFTGFVPEVFWVTKAGDADLAERYAVRPTSETVIHDAMRSWIRSWRDLPLLLNVWNSVLRAEIKSTKPFVRTTEFLWQEGHTAHATSDEAEKEVMQQLRLYERVLEELLSIPAIIGKKSDKEKFVGAVYTTTLESMMPDGKAIQMGTSHFLGQNFSKPFDIRFLGVDGEMHEVYHTSWGLSWRVIGALIMTHGDNKGLVIPPKVAPVQIVIVPIVFSDTSMGKQVLDKCDEAESTLGKGGLRVTVDSRENYTPGWKFNDWEMKGIPLRIEIGPRDIEKNTLIFVRRDTGAKKSVPFQDLLKEATLVLGNIQDALLDNARNSLRNRIFDATSFELLSEIIQDKGGFVRAFWCGSRNCEDSIKEKTGADIRVLPFEQPANTSQEQCVYCKEEARFYAYFAKAY